MADIPSLILKGLGIVLILVGLSGTAAGIYGLKVVYDYGPEKIGGATGSITEVRDTLIQNREEITRNIEEGADRFSNTSTVITRAGESIDSAAVTVGSAAESISRASAGIEAASASNKEAGDLLEDAATGLRSWAEDYSYNGSPLPQKSSFQSAVGKIEDASAKLKASGDDLDSGAAELEKTATALNGTMAKLGQASLQLKEAGASLQGASENFEALRKPSRSVIGEMISPLEDTTEGLASRGDTKTYAYLVIGYFILLHVMMLGLGIALVIIEINLFYPIA
ncbi:MAG: hypothetical protein GXO65_04185 [Euryarchaeota archaeon]|nr:hypothetical protein [Euryarchaeota archaeon]